MEWIIDRQPSNEEMEWNKINKRYEKTFLVSAEGCVCFSKFTRYPKVKEINDGKPKSRKWFVGYWLGFKTEKIDGWMPLPEPIKNKN